MGYKVILNVYNLSDLNKYLSKIGLGVYHSGIELNDSEFTFGRHEYSFTGVFSHPPKAAFEVPYLNLKCSLVLGECLKASSEIQEIINQLSKEFLGNTYNLFDRNCNHFSQAFCKKLLGIDIPAWVNRIAKFGKICDCFFPSELSVDCPTNGEEQSFNEEKTQRFVAFSGEGHQLISSSSNESKFHDSSNSKMTLSLPSLLTTTGSKKKNLPEEREPLQPQETAEERRKKLLEATTKRLQRKQIRALLKSKSIFKNLKALDYF